MSSWTRNHWQNAEAIELSPDARFGAFESSARAPLDLQSQSIILDPGPQFAGDDIADNTSTTTTISVGQSIASSIQTNGDVDYFRITLTAGQTYTFSLAGLSDAYVELRDASGALVAENDDGGINLNSFLMYRAATSGTFYVVARHYTPVPDQFNPTVTGNYTLSVNSITQGETSPTTFPNNSLPHFSWDEAAIQISRSGYSWAQSFGTAATVTYSYRSTAPGTMPDDTSGFSRFSAAQISATEAALAAWASVANITFVRVNDGDGYSNSAAIVFGNYSSGSAGAAAFAYNPSSGDQTVGSSQGDVWINSSLSYNANPVVGDYGQQVLLHEIGHALGLNHPADYNAGNGVSIEYGTHATYYNDSRMFTSMSYFSASNTGGITSLYASLPELHDIAAIQRLYGANITTRTGDTIYGFNSNTGLPEYIIALATEAAIFTVWDGGGVDTLDFSGYSTNNVIDLRAESFSNVGPTSNAGSGLAIFNISIARGVVIENAIGGSGSDTIIGNSVANILNGGAGADTMSGGGGNDTYIVDSVADTINEDVSAGTDLIQSSVSFTISANVENLLLTGAAQLNGVGNALDNRITGNSNVNALAGLAGNDTLIGAAGDDELNGGVGIDTAGYSIASTSATWVRSPDGTWTVTAGAEGSDTVTSVEYLDFTDRDIFLDRPQSNFSTDGVSDFFLRNTVTGGMVMWFNASGSNAASLGNLSTNWINEGAGDFNGDGRDDIVWRDSNTGNISMWFMNNQAVTSAAGLGLSLAWSISGIGDLNGDLKDDFVLRSNTGDIVLWFMDGGAVTGASLGNVATVWQIEVLGDFNGDGRDDFIWRNSSTGDMSMWLMNGTAVTPNNFANVGGNWNIVGVGDLSGDGRDDVIWRDQTTGNTALWFMNGGTIVSQSGFNVATNYSIADVGDYNGDGRDDIIWRNSATNDVLAWYMNGATVQGSAFVGGLGADWVINPGG